MFVSRNGEIVEMDCGAKPAVRPPWCRARFVTIIEGESMTQQAHKDLTDVNAIIQRFDRTGVMPMPKTKPQYADVTGLQVDLTTAFNESQAVLRQAGEFAATWNPAPDAPAPAPAPAQSPAPNPVD